MRIHEYLLDFFMTLFALSSLALWGIILSGGSFRAYAILALLVPLASAYLVFRNGRNHIPPDPENTAPERYGNRFGIETITIFVLLLLIFFSKSEPVTFVLLLVALFLFLRQTNTRPWHISSSSTLERSPLVPGAALLIAVTYTLVSHRYDPDDAVYLFFGLLPLDQPLQAMNLFPFYDTAKMTVSYPTIEAVVSYWTGTSFLQVYYLVVPALAALLAVLAYYGLFQRLGGSYAGVLTLMTVIILILWADKHQAPGNDTFVRLYQGKSIFYAMVCPYLISSAIGVLTRFPGSSFRLAMASITGIGLTQSAIILIPLFFAGLTVTAWIIYREPPRHARYLPFLVGGASFLVLGIFMAAGLGGIPTAKNLRFDTLHEALDFRYGDGLRGYLGIASICLLPLLAHNAARHKATIALSAGLALVVLNPIVVFLVAKIAWSLAWRLQWLLPLAGTVAVGIFLVADFIARGRPYLRLLLCALGLIGFAMLGHTTFYKHNRNAIGIPQIKPPPTVNGVFERHHNGRYKLHAEYRLENGRICMSNGCY
ncbi:MAG: DUF6077 domain-containing protein [Gammaproteobacteria bacterium]|nr:DUF6077 domain-containing protein [Gammaproteobacteria bacterium]